MACGKSSRLAFGGKIISGVPASARTSASSGRACLVSPRDQNPTENAAESAISDRPTGSDFLKTRRDMPSTGEAAEKLWPEAGWGMGTGLARRTWRWLDRALARLNQSGA